MSDITTFFNTHKPKSTPGVLDLAIQHTPPGDGDIALDFCCGVGRLTSMAANRGYLAYGIDIASTYIGKQGEDAAGYVVADVSQTLPFDTASASAIYCIDSLHYFANPDSVLSEFARLLRPGGLLIFSTQNNYNLAGVKRFLIKKLTGKTWSPWLVHPVESSIIYPWLVQALKRHGFQIEYKRGLQFITPWVSLLPRKIRAWSPWKDKPYRSIDALAPRIRLPEPIETSLLGQFAMIVFICAKKM
jgi:SAM-dependent methyltransferase